MAVDISYRVGWIDNLVAERADRIFKQAKLPSTGPRNVIVEIVIARIW